MAQLQSAGVSVTVIDESFYTPAAPGTVPLIVVASEESKQNGAGTGTAPGTLKANAGKVYLLTSQKDLSDTFGTPIFQTDANNNPVHAGELNEYGLQAAYSFLGVSNSAYVVRADIDLAQLAESADAPTGEPADGTIWIDTSATDYGIFQWNSAPASVLGGQTFTAQTPLVITDTVKVVDFEGGDYTPLASIGTIGSYAIVSVTNLNTIWFKKPKTNSTSLVKWVEVGSTEWVASWPTAQGTTYNSAITLQTTDVLTINTVNITGAGITTLTAVVNAINNNATLTAAGITAGMETNQLQLFSTGVDIAVSGTSVAKLGLTSTTYLAPALSISKHTQIPTYKRTEKPSTNNGIPTGAVWVKTTPFNLGANWDIQTYSANKKQWVTDSVSIYKNNTEALKVLDATGGGLNIATGTLYLKYNDAESTVTQHSVVYPQSANFKLYRRKNVGATTIVSDVITSSAFPGNTYSFTISESLINTDVLSAAVTISFDVTSGDTAVQIGNALIASINNASLVNVSAILDSSNRVVISHNKGGDIRLVDGNNTPISTIFNPTRTANLYASPNGVPNSFDASNWTSVGATGGIAIASPTAPSSLAADGQLWYDSNISEIDILVHNGTEWVGYKFPGDIGTGKEASPYFSYGTDVNGPIISVTKPKFQSDGVTPVVIGDLWISTADLENYPLVYIYDFNNQWRLLDNSDQTTENGILFHDARSGTSGGTAISAPSGTIIELLSSDYVDFDAPDPALYPKGMLLWNLRRSGFNVKKFVKNYVNTLEINHRYGNQAMTEYYPHRWISEAANQSDGSGSFGRKSQRGVVLQAMAALINSNQQIRDEDRRVFNLLAAPGYPELIKPLVNLNYDRGLTAFVVGDSPARLTSDATTLSNWGLNENNALEDNDDGLVTTDAYLGVFYPWGYTRDNIGNNIAVPPSHMMLRTIALSDNVSYPWFAPAGVRRGGITNASAVGYITAEGEFNSISLNTGQRDTLQKVNVNPITYIVGTGLVNYGQKTRQVVTSAMDRINVARLIIYLRVQLARISKPYIFEPNDTQTRNEIKQQIESFLLELVGQRALYDFLVVCDTSNNTPTRIDANELYVDIAIEPVKAVEFIYIPLRIENTGAIAKLGQS
jgi:hypothetical protein